MPRRALIGLVGTAFLAAACGLLTAGPDPEAADELVDRAFVSTSVTEAGAPRPLVDGPLEVSFRRPPGEAMQTGGASVLVGWTSGCNDYSLMVEVTANRLREHPDAPEGPEGTLIGCEPPMTEQEAWLTEFFTGSPRWDLRRGVLTLSSRGVEIELEDSS